MHNEYRRFLYCAAVGLFAFILAKPASAAIVNVTCTNAVADTTALNNAINSSGNGDAIQIHGTCLVNQTIVLKGDRSYLGDSRAGTVIRQANNANLAALVASDAWYNNWSYTGDPIRIAHMTLDGNSAANTGTTDLVIHSWLTTVEDMVIQYAPADGIRFTDVSQNGTAIAGNKPSQVNSHASNLMIQFTGGDGVRVVQTGGTAVVTDSDLEDSWIASTNGSGINLDSAAGWKIHGNHLYNIQKHGVYAQGCYGTSIADNYIEDFGDSGGNTTYYGIACTLQVDPVGSVISGNKVFMLQAEHSGTNYIYVGVPWLNSAGTGKLNVSGNIIVGTGSTSDTGLSYNPDGPSATYKINVLSSNNVQSVGSVRNVVAGTTIITPQ